MHLTEGEMRAAVTGSGCWAEVGGWGLAQQGLEPTWDKATLRRTVFSHLTFFSWLVCWLLWPLFNSQAPLVSRMVMMELRALFVPFVFRPLNYSCVGNKVSLLKVAASLAVNMAWELGRLNTPHRFADTGPRAKGARTRQDKRQFFSSSELFKTLFLGQVAELRSEVMCSF